MWDIAVKSGFVIFRGRQDEVNSLRMKKDGSNRRSNKKWLLKAGSTRMVII
jgi:hypothetical protein